ncbi:26675_t:CDS:2 [Racocetra persica]|uniref:26675_t:CDS:1 n=1 Tax=Racocetra persica TaxID=160502 RepID=A0ACA9NBW4_9GLOM|nr:26675_t:CDS:2 [Racocetra persica]
MRPRRNKVSQKQWNTEYKRQYRIRKCAKLRDEEALIKQRQKNTTYKHQYRARITNVNKFCKSYSTYETKFWWDILYTLGETPLSPMTFTWDRSCPYCSTMLLTDELAEFCCNHGKRILPLLPSYPTDINSIFNNTNISTLSRKLNSLFTFTAIGVQGQFVHLSPPSSVCITGRTYHRILPANMPNHSIHWYLYDEQERYLAAQSREIPDTWVSIIQSMLTCINPYVHSLQMLRDNSSSTALLELCENTSTGEVAAIIHANNTTSLSPRSIIIWRHTDTAPKFVNILSSQYEPLQYPLFFPHGTPGWHANNYYDLSQIDWYRCRLLHEQRFLIFGRLTSEYLVDMYSRVEEERLTYILNEKNRLNKEKKNQRRTGQKGGVLLVLPMP